MVGLGALHTLDFYAFTKVISGLRLKQKTFSNPTCEGESASFCSVLSAVMAVDRTKEIWQFPKIGGHRI